MQVHIKDLAVDMDLGNNGLVLAVSDTKGKHLGNLRVGKAKIIWYKGKTQDPNGIEVSWDDLTTWFEGREDQ